MQHKTFQKFLQDDYEFVVWNDAPKKNMQKEIEGICEKYHIHCIAIPQEIHDKPYLKRPLSGPLSPYHAAPVRNSNVVQYSLDSVGFDHDDIVVLIDSDLFLIKNFSFSQYLDGFDLAGNKLQCDKQWYTHTCDKAHPEIEPFHYLWIGLVFLNVKTMPNKRTIDFNCGYLYNNVLMDAGGFTHYYLRDNQNAKIKSFDRRSLEPEKNKLPFLICPDCAKKPKPAPPCTHNTKNLKHLGLENKTIEMIKSMPLFGNHGRSIELFLDGIFLHYRGGTNYNKLSQEYHKQKMEVVENFMEAILL
ncbi:hypothetical protein HRU45_00985 [Candidatus Dependentiae bacterium]|nr:hypothetical protein [Candidatus Dependentiae bacterium]